MAWVVPISCLPCCPSLLQRELATRLQSEVTALRVQLETGGCVDQQPSQLNCFGSLLSYCTLLFCAASLFSLLYPASLPAAEAATWANRCEGLRGSLAAQEAHAAALETELGSRPTQQQVDDLRQQASQGLQGCCTVVAAAGGVRLCSEWRCRHLACSCACCICLLLPLLLPHADAHPASRQRLRRRG